MAESFIDVSAIREPLVCARAIINRAIESSDRKFVQLVKEAPALTMYAEYSALISSLINSAARANRRGGDLSRIPKEKSITIGEENLVESESVYFPIHRALTMRRR